MKKKQKRRYRIRNWREYNAALVGRGSLTVWLDEAVLSVWFEADKSGGRGASRTYSATAIEAILLLKAVYHLPLRAAQGFVQSVLALLGLTLPVPHYSTLSRRQIGLELGFPVRKSQESLHLRHYIWWWTRRAARFTAKASGRCACTARANDAHGASCIWAWTNQVVRLWPQC